MGDTIVVVSGYFNPLHAGHLQYFEGARKLGSKLIVIVNNDQQQILKKNRIIMRENERLRIARALRIVDEAVLAIDHDQSVCQTLEKIAAANKGKTIIFANGGDRDSRTNIPETEICDRLGIEVRFGVGGTEKVNSSTDIMRELESDDSVKTRSESKEFPV